MIVSNDSRYVKDIALRAMATNATMTVMGYVIRPVQSAMELASVFDVMRAQLEPALDIHDRDLADLVDLFPECRAVMLLAEDDGRIAGGAYIGAHGNIAIALVPTARGQGLGTRLARRLEEGATWLGLPAVSAELPPSAIRRTTFDWRYDLSSLRARRQQRAAAVARLRAEARVG
jgi:GNAT superfamily N-acetyltransferase